MKKIILILLTIALVILIGGFVWWQKTKVINDNVLSPDTSSQSNENEVYTIDELSVKFKIPSGWYAKPYPYDNTPTSKTVFLNPKDFTFPEAWGGPLTPIIVSASKNNLIGGEAHTALLKDEPHLQVENLEFKGYKAIRVKGVPKETAYIGGTYHESFSIQRGADVVSVSYYGGDPKSPQYLEQYQSIIESLEI